MSAVLEKIDLKQLPRDLTPSERQVAEITIELAFARDSRTVNLTEVAEEFQKRTGRNPKHVRTTVNHFIKSLGLKTLGAPELGYKLINRGNLGRGNIAEYTWVKHSAEKL